MKRKDFGKDFVWGAAISAFQNEGFAFEDNKSASIWDTFANETGKIKLGQKPGNTAEFYTRYKNDLKLLKQLNLNAFRFSLSWSRIMPDGRGAINKKGVDYYKRVIDQCHKLDIEPWVTLYHWDLPQKIQDIGGWTNRDILDYFNEYAYTCAKHFGGDVKNWMVLNEPMSFVGLGYYMGYHAPGMRGIQNFLPAAHHAALCQASGGRILKEHVKNGNIGTTFSCSHVEAVNFRTRNKMAANRMDALLNRFFIEPSLGLGYPIDAMPKLSAIYKYFQPNDEDLLRFDFDFIGLQYYFRVVTRFNIWPPIVFANEIKPCDRHAEVSALGTEIYPKGLYKTIKKFAAYPQVKKIIITECGVGLNDQLTDGAVNDEVRKKYIKQTLKGIDKAINYKKLPVAGYFHWSLNDNFEWSDGFYPRFGLYYTDFQTQERILKDSGKWVRDFLK